MPYTHKHILVFAGRNCTSRKVLPSRLALVCISTVATLSHCPPFSRGLLTLIIFLVHSSYKITAR
ncbi:Uncharacterized protein APZ42_034147 [Daphnia magna]|uniref:Uncharacterized protein n=1 Tax=Daphnia magna TaxID=35525 RepID=A0A164KGR9_9CRUS|nr:Uncharacterized protein APZ42_034147 [Daphnia magna]